MCITGTYLFTLHSGIPLSEFVSGSLYHSMQSILYYIAAFYFIQCCRHINQYAQACQSLSVCNEMLHFILTQALSNMLNLN